MSDDLTVGQFMEASRHMRALEQMAGEGLVPHDPRTVLILKAGEAVGLGVETRRMVKDKRAQWRDYVAVLQRRWQRETRRPARARHHDSIAIRERYVRGHLSQREMVA